MLKINKNEFINEESIECICEYNSKPLTEIAVKARREGKASEFRGRNGLKSFIMMDDGYLFLCPLRPGTYIERTTKEEYLVVSLRCYLKKKLIREISIKLSARQRRDLKDKKEKKEYINLAKDKSVTHYIFMKSGHIYGTHLIKEDFEEIC